MSDNILANQPKLSEEAPAFRGWRAVMTHGALGAIIAVSVIVGVMMLTTGHNWGDDFSAYIGQAKSIAEGRPSTFVEANRFTEENSTSSFGPVAYPWGYPLLLAPFYAVFGLNLLALKTLTIACWALALFCFAALLGTRLSPLVRILTVALLAFNVQLLGSMDELLSDIPFVWVSLLALWMIDRFVVRQMFWGHRATSYVVLGGVLWFAAITRANGLLLLPVLALCQVVEAIRRPRTYGPTRLLARTAVAAMPYLLFAVLYGLSLVVIPEGGNSYLANFPNVTLAILWRNTLYT